MSAIHRHILLENEKEHAAARAILSKPVKVGGSFKRRTVVLVGHVGSMDGRDEFVGRRALWFIEDSDEKTETWKLIVEALAPLKLRITDDMQEVQEFLGRA